MQRTLLLATLVGLALLSAGPALAQDVPSVSVRPLDSSLDDPNAGGWFVLEIEPGGEGSARAAVTNPAGRAQEVRVTVRDLQFGPDGTGALPEGEDAGLGAWSVVDQPTLRIPAGQTRIVGFSVRVPLDAEPGDHIGALVATTVNRQGDVDVRRQIATRFYVTVPGEAHRSMVIDEIAAQYDSKLWPSLATVTVMLENDGRIRLRPQVSVAGNPASGSAVLLSRSTEAYVTTLPVSWWGGILRLPVEATAEGGLTRAVTTSRVVVPWGLTTGLLLAAALAYLGRRWYRTKASSTAELRADIQRLERIVTQQVKLDGGAVQEVEAEAPDEEALLRAAWKRAQRSGDTATMARVALGLHALTGDEKALVAQALDGHEGKHRAALELALTDYEPKPAAKKKAAPKKKAAAKKAAAKKAAPRKPQASSGHKTAKRAPAKPKKKG